MENPKKAPMFVAAFLLALALISVPAFGEESSPGSDEWEFMVIPYLWMSSLEGDVGVKGIPAHKRPTIGQPLVCDSNEPFVEEVEQTSTV